MITQWDWGTPKTYMHDQVSTDKRKPTVNAYGKHYGATEESSDFFPVFDPKTNSATMVHMPVRDADMELTKNNTMAPSAYWGDEAIWDSKTSMHNPMMDERGDVWFTSRVGNPPNPAFCQAGSDHPSAKVFPIKESTRHLAYYNPKTGETKLIRTCFNTHHLVFARRCQQHAVDQCGGPAARRGRLVQPQSVRGDRRRGEGPRLDRRSSSTPTATASATSSCSRTSRSTRPRTSASMPRSMASA